MRRCHADKLSRIRASVFFIGGLPEIGEMLAKGVIKKTLHMKSAYVLAGRDASVYGWGPLLEEFDLAAV